MDIEFVNRKEGFSPVKIPQRYDFYNTVKTEVTSVLRKEADLGQKTYLPVVIYRATISSSEEATDWLNRFSALSHTRWIVKKTSAKKKSQSPGSNKRYAFEFKPKKNSSCLIFPRFESLNVICSYSQQNKQADSPNSTHCPAYIYIRIKSVSEVSFESWIMFANKVVEKTFPLPVTNKSHWFL